MDLYLFRHEQQTGPYTEADARALVASGEIERTCPAWREGMAEWLPLEQTVAFPPPPPARSTYPEGLPPVPARPVEATKVKAWSDQLEKRLAASKFGPALERHGGWVGRLVGASVLMFYVVKCRHGH